MQKLQFLDSVFGLKATQSGDALQIHKKHSKESGNKLFCIPACKIKRSYDPARKIFLISTFILIIPKPLQEFGEEG